VIVLGWNLQGALAYCIWPEQFTPSFELSGKTGEAAVRGIGVLFLMWNVPYFVAAWDPLRNKIALLEALAMQTIGLGGESWIYLTLDPAHSIARATITRFIGFDAAGLILLVIAVWLTRTIKSPYN